ncbi:hypothetical protein ABK040_003810 [Willaertia magna]
MIRKRPSLAIRQINFEKYWNELKLDILNIMNYNNNNNLNNNNLNNKINLKHDIDTLHNFVYKLSTGHCINLPKSLQNNNYGISQEGNIQPHSIYFLFKNLMKEIILQKLQFLQKVSKNLFLENYLKIYKNFFIGINFLNKIFHYLNKDFLQKEFEKNCEKFNFEKNFEFYKNCKVDKIDNLFFVTQENKSVTHFSKSNVIYPIKETCLLLWKEIFFENFENLKITKNIFSSFFELIEKDRNVTNPSKKYFTTTNFTKNVTTTNEEINYKTLKGIKDSFLDLSLEKFDFYFLKYKNLFLNENFYKNLKIEKLNNLQNIDNFPIFYKIYFELPILEITQNYYKNENLNLINYLENLEKFTKFNIFFNHILQRMEQESIFRIYHYFHFTTSLQKYLFEIFLEKNENLIFNEIYFIFENLEILNLFLKLILKSQNKNILQKFLDFFKNKILQEGFNELNNLQNLQNLTTTIILQTNLQNSLQNSLQKSQKNIDTPILPFIEILFNLFIKYTNLIKNNLKNYYEFNIVKDKAFPELVNHFTKSPEIFAKYSDILLKEKNEENFDLCITFISYLNDIDIFIHFYKVFLAKRLVQENYMEDLELQFLNKLKKICSFAQIYKIQTMFNDKMVAVSLNEQFKNYENNLLLKMEEICENTKKKLSFSCLVLTKGFWPFSVTNNSIFSSDNNNLQNVSGLQKSLQQMSQLIIPKTLQKRMDDFTKFYHELHTGRNLQWLHYLSRGILRVNYCNKNYEFTVSLQQCILLLLYNNDKYLICDNSDKNNCDNHKNIDNSCDKNNCDKIDKKIVISVKEMMEESGLNFDEIKLAISSLLKYHVLTISNGNNDNTTLQNVSTLQQTSHQQENTQENTQQTNHKKKLDNITQNTQLLLNINFSHSKTKLQFFTIQLKQLDTITQQDQQIYKQIQQDRKYTIQACIVRILKTKKLLEHTQLINFVMKQLNILNFMKVTINEIKLQIDYLIEMDYMKRVENNTNWYEYIA